MGQVELNQVEQFLEGGCAFIPKNIVGVGDQLSVYFQNGEYHHIALTSRWFLDQVIRYFGNDPVEMRRIYGQATGRKYHTPLPLTSMLTLVPFKVRKPVGRQAAYGWFVAEQIKNMRQMDHTRTEVNLSGKHTITVLQSIDNCRQQMNNVAMVKLRWKALHHIHLREEQLDYPYLSYRFYE